MLGAGRLLERGWEWQRGRESGGARRRVSRGRRLAGFALCLHPSKMAAARAGGDSCAGAPGATAVREELECWHEGAFGAERCAEDAADATGQLP